MGNRSNNPIMKSLHITSLIFLFAFLSSIDTYAEPIILFVAPVGMESGSCDSWANACDLQYAITIAISGDEIWVKAGTYKPTTGADRTISFNLKNGVSIYGGFAGTETERSQRDWENNVTSLSGDIGTEEDKTDNTYHVVYGIDIDNTSILDGFTMTGGNADKIRNYYGGGIYNYNSNPALSNITLSNNSAYYGGGMYNYNSSPTLSNVTFTYNSSKNEGGGMFNSSHGNPILSNVNFNNNFSVLGGGGMFNASSASPTLSHVTFSDNSSQGHGGGIYNEYSSNPTISDVTITNNHAYRGGGMFNYDTIPITLTNVTFSNNSAEYGGGGLYNYSTWPTLFNVTFSSNSAIYGGGIFNDYSWPTLSNITFSNNSADEFGSGMLNYYCRSTIDNSVFWGNLSDQIYNYESSANINRSIIQGGCPNASVCTNVLDFDPLLGPLGNYGGFTQTIPLLVGSPAVDSVPLGECPLVYDQRGVTRPQGGSCDMGAYESAQVFSWFDHMNDARYTDRWLASSAGAITILETSKSLREYIIKPLSDCSQAVLTSVPSFIGENIFIETGVGIKGSGKMFLRLKKDDNNFVQFGLNMDSLPNVIMGSSNNGIYSEENINALYEYSVKKRYKYKTFGIQKTGDTYNAYLNGIKVGNSLTNEAVGNEDLKVELLNVVCSTDTKGLKNEFDYVFESYSLFSGSYSNTVSVLKPNGGEIIIKGSIYLIQWNAPEAAVSFTIEYSLDNGTKWSLIDSKVNGRNYTWKLSKGKSSSSYTVRITGYDAAGNIVGSDTSDATFSISY